MSNLTLRLLPPLDVARQTITVNGRSYSAALGSYVDAANQGDAALLRANGWIIPIVQSSGPTTSRPTVLEDGISRPAAGYGYIDTTVGAVIVWDGATWRSPATGAGV